MNNPTAYQSEIVAQQRMADSAHAAREYTRRHAAPHIDDPAPRRRHFHVAWPHLTHARAAHT